MALFRFLILLVIVIAAGAVGCTDDKASTSSKLSITATTGMIEDAVRNVAGDRADVVALMGPGVDPHLYKATQGDLAKLSNADIVFYNGLHLEGKMVDVLEKLARQKPAVAVADGIEESALRSPPEFKG